MYLPFSSMLFMPQTHNRAFFARLWFQGLQSIRGSRRLRTCSRAAMRTRGRRPSACIWRPPRPSASLSLLAASGCMPAGLPGLPDRHRSWFREGDKLWFRDGLRPVHAMAPNCCVLVHEPGFAMEHTMQTRPHCATVLVEPSLMPTFEKRLLSLNRKAAQYGLDAVQVLSTEIAMFERVVDRVGRDGEKLVVSLVPVRRATMPTQTVRLVRVVIEYPVIKLGGWQVVGKLESVENGLLSFAVTDDPADAAYLAQCVRGALRCDHCNTQRQRNDSYALRAATSGEYRQVGSSCLSDYTGIDPAAALFLARMHQVVRLTEADLDGFIESGRLNAVSTLGYLRDVVFLTRHEGFVSATRARETGQQATFERAANISGVLNADPGLAASYHGEREQDLRVAGEVRAWILAREEDTAFDHNVKLLLEGDAIALKRSCLAFAAAAVAVYNRENAIAKERCAPSRHIGMPGQKLSAVVTIERVIPLPSPHGRGVLHLVLMRDAQGNRVVWRASACPDDISLRGEGRSLEAQFKVKAHGAYKGSAQTKVTHLKVLRWVDAQTNDLPDALQAAEA